MKTLISLVAVAVSLAACNSQGSTVADNSGTDRDSVVANAGPSVDTSVAGCYSYISARDTVALQLDRKGDDFRGLLSYNYYEKDRNDGNFEGSMNNGIISGFYLFRSEGVMSVRQEIFRYDKGMLIPGSGEQVQRNDSMLFKNPSTVKFDESRALKKVPCVL